MIQTLFQQMRPIITRRKNIYLNRRLFHSKWWKSVKKPAKKGKTRLFTTCFHLLRRHSHFVRRIM